MYRKLSTLFFWSIATTLLAQNPDTAYFSSHGPGGGGYTYVPVISPHNPELIFMNCDMAGVYRSDDGGDQWHLLPYLQLVSKNKGKIQFCSHPDTLYTLRRQRLNTTDPYWRSEPVISSDGGYNWQVLPDPASSGLHRLEADPNSCRRLIANEYNRLFFSNDGGQNWSEVFHPADDNVCLGGVFWDGPNIFVATNHGLLVSKDNGENFNIENHPGLPETGIYQLSGVKNNGLIQLYAIPVPASEQYAWLDVLEYRGKLKGLFRLDYSPGATWQNLRQNIPEAFEIAWVEPVRNHPNTIWLAAASADDQPQIFKSMNAGQSWQAMLDFSGNANIATGWAGENGAFWLTFNGAALGLAADPNNPDHVLFSDGNGHRSKDGGLSWQATYVQPDSRNTPGQAAQIDKYYKSSGLDVTTAHQVFWNGPNAMYVCNTDIGQTFSQDGGVHWTFSRNLFHDWGPLANNNWYRMVRQASSGHLLAAIAGINDFYQDGRLSDEQLDQVPGLVARSTDGGMHWDTVFNFGHGVVWIENDKLLPQRLYASVAHSTAGGIFMSDDNGASWVKLPAPPRTEGHPYNLISLNDGSLLATFAARETGTGSELSESSGVFLLPPGSNIWQDRTAPEMRFFTKDICVDPHDPAQNTWYATVWGRYSVFSPNPDTHSGKGGLYKSNDRGQNWVRIYADEQAQNLSFHPDNPDLAFLCLENNGLFACSNLRSNQPEFRRLENFPFWRPKRTFFNPYNVQELWVCTMGGGIWKTALTPEMVGTDALPMLSGISLYPNPATTDFSLNINVLQAGNYGVELIGLHGHVLSSRQMQLATGKQVLAYNLLNQAPGVYFVRISHGTQSRTLKLTNLR